MKNIFWKMLEYEQRERSRDWYIAFGIICFALMVTGFILGNVLFGVLVVLSFFTVYLFSLKPPNMIEVEVGERGVRVNLQLYTYQNLDGFWIEELGKQKKLLLRSTKFFMPLVVLPISHEIDTAQLKNFLAERVEEVELQEPFFEKLLERFNF